jgi:hypothetical protein
MIEHLLVCVLSSSPLALTGNENGLWFVGDIEPSASFSSRPHDIDYELCERYSSTQYVVIHPFTRRPLALATNKKTLWFIDEGSGIGLYKIQLSGSVRSSTSRRASLQAPTMEAFFEEQENPTDFLIYQEQPLLAFCDSDKGVLELFQYQEREWNTLQALQGTHIQVAVLQDQLIAAVPKGSGVEMWYLREDGWFGGDKLELEGTLVDLICQSDWPILVSTANEKAVLSGIQQGGLLEIASFNIPKGRWGVSPSPEGITVVGVERKGTTTVLDIGWPSGSLSGPIVLEERFREDDTLLTSILFASMLVVSTILFFKIRRS